MMNKPTTSSSSFADKQPTAHSQSVPGMRRWPFYIGNGVLVLLAAFVAWCGGASLTGFQFFLCFVCVVFGSLLSAVPFLKEHQANIELQKLKAQQLGDDQYTDLQQSLVLTQELKASFVLQAQKHNQHLQAIDQLLHQNLQGFGPLNHKLETLEKALEAGQLMHEQDRVRLENNLANVEHKLQDLCQKNEHGQERLKDNEGLLQQFSLQLALLKPIQQQLGALQQQVMQGVGAAGAGSPESLKNLENQLIARLQSALRDMELGLLSRLGEGVHMAVKTALVHGEGETGLSTSTQPGLASRWKSPTQHTDWLPDILGHMVSEAASESIAKIPQNDTASKSSIQEQHTEDAAQQSSDKELQPQLPQWSNAGSYPQSERPAHDAEPVPYATAEASGVAPTDPSDPFAGLDLADFTPDTRYTCAAAATQEVLQTASQQETEAPCAAPQIPVDRLVEERLQASQNLAISWENLPGSTETPFETIEGLPSLQQQPSLADATAKDDWDFAPPMPWVEKPLQPYAAPSPEAIVVPSAPEAETTPSVHPTPVPAQAVASTEEPGPASGVVQANVTELAAQEAGTAQAAQAPQTTQSEAVCSNAEDNAAAQHYMKEDEDTLSHLSYQQAHGTCIVVRAMLGIGKKPFLRGQGPGLSWNKGAPMEFVEAGQWRWTAPDSSQPIICRVYKNDECPADGEALCLQPGEQLEISPSFRW